MTLTWQTFAEQVVKERDALRRELADLQAIASHAGILRAQEQHNAMMAKEQEQIGTVEQAYGKVVAQLEVQVTEKDAEIARLREELADKQAEIASVFRIAAALKESRMTRPQSLSINGKPVDEWPAETWALWQTHVDPLFATDPRPCTHANYFTPRPRVDEYNRGSRLEGFVYTIGRDLAFVQWDAVTSMEGTVRG